MVSRLTVITRWKSSRGYLGLPMVSMAQALASLTVKLFLAVCRRYGLKPYQRPGQHRTTVMLKVPPSFSQKILVPEFQQLAEALGLYFRDSVERLIENSVFRDSA